MRRPARSPLRLSPSSKCVRRGGSRGILIVEAIISAVVIAVGLAFITRSFGTQLQALKAIEERAVLANLAQAAWLDVESAVQRGVVPVQSSVGRFAEPFEQYERIYAAVSLGDDGLLATSEVSVTVRRAEGAGPAMTLRAVWPTALVPEFW